jgi:acetylornithine deacetylase/succinyl-diaminopimelate desuccinylase-like protein
VIPAEAHAKVSFRLVGEQDPERVRAAFREHMAAAMPPDCRAEHVSHGGARAISMPTDAPAFEAARRSLSEEWGVEAPFIGRAARSRSWATSSASSASTAC